MKFPTLVSAIISAAIFLITWEILTKVNVIQILFPTFDVLYVKAFKLFPSSQFIQNLTVTSYEIGLSFVLAVAAGLVIGLLMGVFASAEYALDPYVTVLLAFPKIVIYPVIFFVFGLAAPSKIVLGFLLALFPFIVNVVNGVKNIDPLLVDVARGYKASTFVIFRKVIMPASMRNIMTGVELAFGRAVTGVILAEVFGSFVGLGNSIAASGELFDFSTLYLTALVVFLIAIVGTTLIRKGSSWLMPWTRA